MNAHDNNVVSSFLITHIENLPSLMVYVYTVVYHLSSLGSREGILSVLSTI
jgi:hypothetical protein